MTNRQFTLQESFDYFCAQSNLSPASLDTYSYAAKHFFEFLESSALAETLSISRPKPQDQHLEELGSSRQDVNLIAWFVNYLGNEVQQTRRRVGMGRSLRLEPATVRLYGQAVITWFRFLADELLLPERFPATAAISQAHRRLSNFIPATQARDSAPEPPEGLEDLIHAYDELEPPDDLPAKEKRRRQLERLRNRSILYALADSGARVSEILRITADDVRGAKLNPQGIWQIQVRGKGRGRYGRQVTLRFTEPTLKSMQEYLETRGDPGATELYVSHARTRRNYGLRLGFFIIALYRKRTCARPCLVHCGFRGFSVQLGGAYAPVVQKSLDLVDRNATLQHLCRSPMPEIMGVNVG